MADAGFFSEANLLRLRFDSAKSALQHLKIEAMKHGFDIATNQSLRSNYLTVYCVKGGRQRGNKTTKVGCQWSLAIVPADDDCREFQFSRLRLQHNHTLDPDKYSVYTLPEDKQDLIRKMIDTGISPTLIQRFLINTGEKELSTLQIRKLSGKSKEFRASETEELCEYMESVDGFFERMETRMDGKTYVHAVFTAMPFELENLKRFGDVIWLDGTQRQNYLSWEIVPVTVIDQFKRIRSGGVFFVSRGDQEVIEWILETLLRNEDLKDQLETIITDEDTAFIPAFNSVVSAFNRDSERSDIVHVLCAFHKEQNFIKKLMKCGLNRIQCETAKDLFKIVCYSSHRQACDDAIEDLKKMSPKLAKYINKHVIPVTNKFTRAYLTDVWTKGYNTTSPAESHNNMIKSGMVPGRVYTLKQMRIDITATHRGAEISFRDKISSSFVNAHFTFTMHDIMLSPKIREQIDIAIKQSSDYSVCLAESTVIHPDTPQYKYKITESRCTCGKHVHSGLPCAHLLAMLAKEGHDVEEDFPVDLISERWIIPSEDAVLIPVNRDGQIEDDAEDGEEGLQEDLSDEAFPASNPLDEPPGNGCFEERDLITALTDKDRFAQQKERYLTLFHLAKTVVSIGSRDHDVSVKLRVDLQGILDELLDLPETVAGASQHPSSSSSEEEESAPASDSDEVVDVQDVVRRRRGRPRKEPSLAERFPGRRKCVLCGGSHGIQACEKYEAFAAAVEHNEAIEDGERRRCSVCRGVGHNRKSCGWVFRPKK